MKRKEKNYEVSRPALSYIDGVVKIPATMTKIKTNKFGF